MNKCGGKMKNPCKICLQPVTNKNGLQCQGACKKWAHFTCLNFTPGKIQDIKAGYIVVTCPCPGCNTTEPKEFLINPPLTCSNRKCAAIKIPRCETPECPSNKPKPIPTVPNALESSDKDEQDVSPYASDTPSVRSSTSCPLCPPCKPCPPCPPTPICPPTPPSSSPPIPSAAVRGTSRKSRSPTRLPGSRPRTKGPSQPFPRPPPKSPPRVSSPARSASLTEPDSRDSSPQPIEPESSTPSQHEQLPSKSRAPSSKRAQKKSESKAKNKIMMSPQRSQSCSCISADSRCKQNLTTSTSESILASNNQLLYRALEDMCKTVGQLSLQLREIMCKMINSMQET